MPTTTNFGWTTPADTDLVKDGAAAIRTLAGNIDTSLVDLKGGTTGQVLTKASGTDLDFDFTTIAAGGVTLISETVLSAVTSVTLSSIPQTYKQILFVFHGVRHSTTGSQFSVRLNNAATSIYKITGLTGKGSVEVHGSTQDQLLGQKAGFNIFGFGRAASGGTLQDDVKGMLLVDNYTSTSKLKFGRFITNYYDSTDGNYMLLDYTFTFNSTSAITSIDIARDGGSATLSNATDTSIRLYGIS